MTEAIIIVVLIMFFLWMIWRMIISRFISDQRVINGTIIILVFANLILLIFSHSKINIVIAFIGVIVFGVMDFILNSGAIEFKEGILKLLEERRENISLLQDMIIDMCIVTITIQISFLLI